MHRMMMQASEYLVALRVIDKNDAAIFRYGLEMMLLTIAEVASVLMIAAFVGNFVETFLYFLAFIPLRLFAGVNGGRGCLERIGQISEVAPAALNVASIQIAL